MTIIKAIKYTPSLSFRACEKKTVELTVSVHIITEQLCVKSIDQKKSEIVRKAQIEFSISSNT